MILSSVVQMKVSNRSIRFYNELGFNNIKQGDIISLPIKYLDANSTCNVDVECDFCNSKMIRNYGAYNKNIKTGGKFCCNKCKPIEYRTKCLEIYGVDNIIKLPKTHDKIKSSCLKKYGNKNYRNIQKRKSTKFEKYGDENFNNKHKYKDTCLERFGVANASQNSLIFSKQQKSRFEIHQYVGSTLFYQGTYEKDFLDKYYKKCNITKIDSISYKYNDKNKQYFSDFYLPDNNLIVEIKSEYTYNRYEAQNLAKRDECLRLGYNFIFIINKNYVEFNKYITL